MRVHRLALTLVLVVSVGTLVACGGSGESDPPSTARSGVIEVILDRVPGSSAQLFSVLVQVPDQNSFRAIDDGSGQRLIGFVASGDHVVQVSDPTPNCQIEGADQKTVSVSASQTVTVSFSFGCTFTPVSRITFGADLEGTGTPTIWTIRPDGTELQQVIPPPSGPVAPNESGASPLWSPDGTRIMYFGRSSRNWIVNYDGSEPRPFAAADGWQATWSPDGSEVVIREGFSGDVGVPIPPDTTQSDLWRVNSDGTDLEQITNDPDQEGDPAWSPDGSMLAIVRQQNDLQLIDLNGSFLISLGPGLFESRPRWSPDGSKLVFGWAPPGEELDIWTVNVDGSNRTQLTDMAAACGGQAYSPDSTEIIFHCDGFMWRMNADGTNQRLFAEIPGPGVDNGADWVGP